MKKGTFSFVIWIYFEQCALLKFGVLVSRDLVFQFPLCSDLNLSMLPLSTLPNVDTMAFPYLLVITWRYLSFQLSLVIQRWLQCLYYPGLQKSITVKLGQIFKEFLLPLHLYFLKSVYLNAPIACWIFINISIRSLWGHV